MECQIQSLSESGGRAEAPVPTGKVESVCKDWLIREDCVLAYKLQNEEFQHHYGHNKEKSQLVRSDIKEARVIQKSEEEEAELNQKAYEQLLMEQEHNDALIAKQIQDKLLQEELEKQRQIEEDDKRIALEMQKQEKLKLQKKREEREVRQLEKMRTAKSESLGSPSSNEISIIPTTTEASTSPLDKDFSELCIEPPPDLTAEELRKFREHQDAELAKYLQEQELKKQATNNNDQRLVIEAQDRELAKLLQENERAKARRAKEKAKQKAMLQQQQQQQNGVQTQEQLERRSSGNSYKDYSPSHLEMKDNEIYSSVEACKTSPSYPCRPVNNIAMVLDPTYTQVKSSMDSPSASYGPMKSSPISPHAQYPRDTMYMPHGLTEELFLNDSNGESIAPPYMPIQGQRRPQTLEKVKKNKKHKDGCPTQ